MRVVYTLVMTEERATYGTKVNKSTEGFRLVDDPTPYMSKPTSFKGKVISSLIYLKSLMIRLRKKVNL